MTTGWWTNWMQLGERPWARGTSLSVPWILTTEAMGRYIAIVLSCWTLVWYFYAAIGNYYHWLGADDNGLIQITLRTLKLNSMGYNKNFRKTGCMSKFLFNKNDLNVNIMGKWYWRQGNQREPNRGRISLSEEQRSWSVGKGAQK